MIQMILAEEGGGDMNLERALETQVANKLSFFFFFFFFFSFLSFSDGKER